MSLCLIGLLLGCAATTPDVVTRHEVVPVIKRVYVPIDEGLTAPVPNEYLPDGDMSTWDMRQTLEACQARVEQCNGRLGDVAGVEGTEARKEE